MTWEFGKNVTWFSAQQVFSFFQSNPNQLNTKRGIEIFAGAVLTAAFGECNVGFPMKEIKPSATPMPGATLAVLIEGTAAVDDNDTDICIEYEEYPTRFQITRLVIQSDVTNAYSQLLKIIDKKLLVQPDSGLHLAVVVQEALLLDLESFHTEIDTRNVPYGSIHVIAVTQKVPLRLQCFQVWPECHTSEQIETGLELRP